MRRAAMLLLVASMLPSAGCGDRSLILTVDVLSFLDPSDVSQSYTVPGGVPSTTMDLASESVNLLPGVQDVTEIATATLHIEASFDNTVGTANGTLLLYIAPADSTDPFSTAPIASIPVALTPGNITIISTDVTSAALAAALVQASARVGVRLTFDSTPTPPLQMVNGTETITQIRATVITKKKL
jgi:hypothetical protein